MAVVYILNIFGPDIFLLETGYPADWYYGIFGIHPDNRIMQYQKIPNKISITLGSVQSCYNTKNLKGTSGEIKTQN